MIELKEKEAYEKYVEVKEICRWIEKIQRAKLWARIRKNKSGRLHYRRKKWKKSNKRYFFSKTLAKVWNLLHRRLLAATLKKKIVYEHNEFIKESIQTIGTAISGIEQETNELFLNHPTLVPKFQSTDKRSEPSSITSDFSPQDPIISVPLSLQMLDGSRGSEACDPHPGLVAPNDGSLTDHFAASLPQLSIIQSPLPDVGVPGRSNVVDLEQSQSKWQDSGYQGANEQSTSSEKEVLLNDIVREVEDYNIMKNVELHDKINEAKQQVSSCLLLIRLSDGFCYNHIRHI